MMYDAGIRTVADVAKIKAKELVKKVKNLNLKQAKQIINGANHVLHEYLTTCKDNVIEMLKDLEGEKDS
jgi:ribosomal protein L7/L12